MKVQKAVFVLMGVILLFAGKLSAAQVKTDYDRSANFGQYKTYSWAQVKTKNALDVDRIKSAVNAALNAKGWTQVDSGGDVSVVAMEITKNQQTLNTFLEAEVLGSQPQQQKPTGSAHWLSIYSTRRPRS